MAYEKPVQQLLIEFEARMNHNLELKQPGNVLTIMGVINVRNLDKERMLQPAHLQLQETGLNTLGNPIYNLVNSTTREILGKILVRRIFKKNRWVFEPARKTVFESVCLREIGNFVRKLAGDPEI